MFIGYAIIPAVVFTLVCDLSFMAALVYGKKSNNDAHSLSMAREMERVLTGYEEELEKLTGRVGFFTGDMEQSGRTQVFENLYGLSNRLGYEADVYLMDKEHRVILSNSQDVPDYFNVGLDVDWGIFEPMDREPGKTAVRLMTPWEGGDRELVLGKAVENPQTVDGVLDSALGYAALVIKGSQFQSYFNMPDTQTMMTDSFGWIYLANSDGFSDSSGQIVPELYNAGSFFHADSHTYLVSRQEIYDSIFYIYSVTDIQNIIVSLAVSSGLILTALILMTVWILFTSRKVTEKKTRDFYKILDVMEMARDGDLNGVIQIDRNNEFRIIADTYNETIASLKRQMENNQRMTELVASSQNKQLESQFNPHFLYNTLENIRYMCRMEPTVAEKMVYSLSGLLRYSLDGSQTEVTLKEDLTHLENYLLILKYRFNRRFSYQIDVNSDVMQYRIPKLVLQPMIENSVKYGFGAQECLKVELKAYIHEGKLVMICRDDGVGIAPGILSELTDLLKQNENKSRHSGIYNIHRRITLLYGHPYGGEIRSTEGFGTTLVVTIPAHTEDITCCGY